MSGKKLAERLRDIEDDAEYVHRRLRELVDKLPDGALGGAVDDASHHAKEALDYIELARKVAERGI